MRLLILILFLLTFNGPLFEAKILELYDSNFDSIIKTKRISFAFVHADFCPFSRKLEVQLNLVSQKLDSEYPNASIGIFKISHNINPTLMSNFRITKYPTMFLFKNGRKTEPEYLGSRQSQDLFDFIIKNYLATPTLLDSIEDLSHTENHVVAVVENTDSVLAKKVKDYYDELMDKCHFAYMLSDNPKLPQGWKVNTLHSVINDPLPDVNELDGDINSNTVVFDWLNVQCNPFVRQITHENAEQILSRNKPLFILFFDETVPEQVTQVSEAVDKIKKFFSAQYRDTFQPILAKYGLFSPALRRISKTKQDLPLFAIDDIQHMYYFGKIADFEDEAKLRVFVDKFISGELHTQAHNQLLEEYQHVVIVFKNMDDIPIEFENGANSNENIEVKVKGVGDNKDVKGNMPINDKDAKRQNVAKKAGLPGTGTLEDNILHEIVKAESEFKVFGPSKYRYSIKKDEL